MSRIIVTRSASITTFHPPYNANTLGMNYANMNFHDGTTPITWLQTYDSAKAEADFIVLANAGIKKIRVFAPLESIMAYTNAVFVMNTTYLDNLKDFLTRANNHGISCILVMSRGETPSAPTSLDGYTRWELVLNNAGRIVYANAMVSYVLAIDSFTNILMYELCNEPYSCASGFSAYAVTESVSQQNTLDWLTTCYKAVKAITTKLVGISEYEEEEQTTYQYFSDAIKRSIYIDPVSDIYSLHVYRPNASYLHDFSDITNKPKWLTEVGNLNYNDPTASTHPLAGNNELYDQLFNNGAVIGISQKAMATGFSLIMPWSFADNPNNIIVHNGDGSHTSKPILDWITSKLATRAVVISRTIIT